MEQDVWHLHAFADASKRAYAAAVYAVVPGSTATLLIAKTKLAPTKVQTLPRLELNGAVLAVRLAKHLLSGIQHQLIRIHVWTDSTIVLEWLKSHPSRWQTFIANRTSEIVSQFPTASWRHVKSQDNPADCATRGLTPIQLKDFDLWWNGPPWLTQPKEDWPIPNKVLDANDERTQCHLAQHDSSKISINTRSEMSCLDTLIKFSSFSKIVRIVAYCYRWRLNAVLAKNSRRSTHLTSHELTLARIAIFRVVQSSHFSVESKKLKSGKAVPFKSSLSRLNPFICTKGLIRIGGRLQAASVSYDEKHPIILPGSNYMIKLLVQETHITTLHGGVQLMLSHLGRYCWIISGRRLDTSIYRKCTQCTRFAARTLTQQMAPLPAIRVTPSRPFASTGLDYAGPFPILFSKGHVAKTTKGYVAIFVCLVVRAVHIEVVSNLTTDAFLAAFARFSARRGLCNTIYSDNATTFRGASVELSNLFKQSSDFVEGISSSLATQGINWVFIPLRALHFGGLWEAAVQSFKHHLVRVIGDATLSFEEFSTLTTKIEDCLNSRPLSPMSNDGEDIAALTPAHFLVGSSLLTHPEPVNPSTPDRSTLSNHWRLITQLQHSFWQRWKKEALQQLQQGNKCLNPQPNIQKGDVVILKDELSPPTRWPLELVEDVHPGPDGLVRTVTVRTPRSTFMRPIVKLVKLPVEPSESTAESTLQVDGFSPELKI